MLFLPVAPLRKTKKCERCGLSYPKSEAQCTHCADVADGRDLEGFIAQKEAETHGNKNLGLLFLLLGLVFTVALLILYAL